jgi:RNA polymerase sigma factor (sigma-70 family)
MSPGLDHLDDEALVALATAAGATERAHAAAETLLERYRERVHRWCLRYTQDHDSAVDLAQEVLIKVHAALPHFAGRARVGTWIFAVVRNECVSAMRRRQPRVEGDEILELLADPSPGPDRQLVEREAEERLLALIRTTLEPMEQDALWMRCIDRLPIDAITTSLRIAGPSGARGVLQNARRKLRAALAREEER